MGLGYTLTLASRSPDAIGCRYKVWARDRGSVGGNVKKLYEI